MPRTTGAELAGDLRRHMEAYGIDICDNRRIERFDIDGGIRELHAKGGEVFRAPALVVATGASWRRLGVPGEAEYIGRGVAFCPHCDGPFYAGRHVAVIGGGNSGVEAAIDLAGTCASVTVLEFMETLKADQVLQEKLRTLPNVEVHTNVQTLEVEGDGSRMTALRMKDRSTGAENGCRSTVYSSRSASRPTASCSPASSTPTAREKSSPTRSAARRYPAYMQQAM